MVDRIHTAIKSDIPQSVTRPKTKKVLLPISCCSSGRQVHRRPRQRPTAQGRLRRHHRHLAHPRAHRHALAPRLRAIRHDLQDNHPHDRHHPRASPGVTAPGRGHVSLRPSRGRRADTMSLTTDDGSSTRSIRTGPQYPALTCSVSASSPCPNSARRRRNAATASAYDGSSMKSVVSVGSAARSKRTSGMSSP